MWVAELAGGGGHCCSAGWIINQLLQMVPQRVGCGLRTDECVGCAVLGEVAGVVFLFVAAGGDQWY